MLVTSFSFFVSQAPKRDSCTRTQASVKITDASYNGGVIAGAEAAISNYNEKLTVWDEASKLP